MGKNYSPLKARKYYCCGTVATVIMLIINVLYLFFIYFCFTFAGKLTNQNHANGKTAFQKVPE